MVGMVGWLDGWMDRWMDGLNSRMEERMHTITYDTFNYENIFSDTVIDEMSMPFISLQISQTAQGVQLDSTRPAGRHGLSGQRGVLSVSPQPKC